MPFTPQVNEKCYPADLDRFDQCLLVIISGYTNGWSVLDYCHCEARGACRGNLAGLLRRCAPRNDSQNIISRWYYSVTSVHPP